MPNDPPVRDREGCQFSLLSLLLLLLGGAIIMALVTSTHWPTWARVGVGGYLLVLLSYAALRGGYFYRHFTRRTRRWQEFHRRRTEIEREAIAEVRSRSQFKNEERAES